MIESESFSNQQIIVELFDNKEIEFIKNNGNVWITSSAVAKGLEIDRRNVNQIYQNNNALLNPYSCVIKLMIHEKDRNVQREVRIFDKTGFIGICMRSNSSKAVPFQQWTLRKIDELLTKGYSIEKIERIDDSNDLSFLIKQSEITTRQSEITTNLSKIVTKTLMKIDQLELKLNDNNKALKKFEQKYEDEKKIGTETLRKIKDIVRTTHDTRLLAWMTIWSKIWSHFEIASVKDISEKLALKIVEWLEQTTYFIKPEKQNLINDF